MSVRGAARGAGLVPVAAGASSWPWLRDTASIADGIRSPRSSDPTQVRANEGLPAGEIFPLLFSFGCRPGVWVLNAGWPLLFFALSSLCGLLSPLGVRTTYRAGDDGGLYDAQIWSMTNRGTSNIASVSLSHLHLISGEVPRSWPRCSCTRHTALTVAVAGVFTCLGRLRANSTVQGDWDVVACPIMTSKGDGK